MLMKEEEFGTKRSCPERNNVGRTMKRLISVCRSRSRQLEGMLAAFLVLSVLAIGACSSEPLPSGGEKKTYRIGFMICNSAEETLDRFRPLTAYLAKQLDIKLEAVAIDTIDFAREIESVDFTHTNSLLYIILNRFHGVEVLAAEKAGSLGAKTQGAIVALKKSNIRTLEDLQGKTMLFGPMFAPSAYLSQMDLLVRAGFDPEEYLANYSIPGGSFKHEKLIYGVLFGAADAGAFPMLDFERMVASGKLDPEEFTVIAEAPPIVYCNFGVTQKVDADLAAAFRKELLTITLDATVEIEGEIVRVLKQAWVDGYAEISDRDFDPVRDMARRTNMPPYQTY